MVRPFYERCPVYFDINYMKDRLIAPDEVFVHLDQSKVHNIEKYYMVSNYGRIYNIYTDKFLVPQIGTDGYYAIALAVVNEPTRHRMFRINRLVMMGFYPIPNADQMVVNHIDCNPLNNHISNLEWTTRGGNAIHAYDNGLMKCGEDGPTAKITEAQAIQIGTLLRDTNLTYKEIADIVGGNTTWCIVQNISQGKQWVRTMKKHGIDCVRENTSRVKRFRLTKEDVHNACKLFVKYPNPGLSTTEYLCLIAEQLNCFGLDMELKELLNTLKPIYMRTNHKDIVSQYNF